MAIGVQTASNVASLKQNAALRVSPFFDKTLNYPAQYAYLITRVPACLLAKLSQPVLDLGTGFNPTDRRFCQAYQHALFLLQ